MAIDTQAEIIKSLGAAADRAKLVREKAQQASIGGIIDLVPLAAPPAPAPNVPTPQSQTKR